MPFGAEVNSTDRSLTNRQLAEDGQTDGRYELAQLQEVSTTSAPNGK